MAKKKSATGKSKIVEDLTAKIPGVKKASEIPGIPADDPRRIYTVPTADAAQTLGTSINTLIRRAESGEIPHLKINAGLRPRYFFRPEDLEDFNKNSMEVVDAWALSVGMDKIATPEEESLNPEISEAVKSNKKMFRNWGPEDWNMLNIRGHGGALTHDGVLQRAEEINDIRKLRAKFNAVMLSHLRPILTAAIESMYKESQNPKKES